MAATTKKSAPTQQSRPQRSRGPGSRTFCVSSRVTEEELGLLERAATDSGKAVSEWAREVLMEAAQNCGPDVVLVEVVATRMLVVNLLKMLGQNHPITEAEYAKVQSQVQGAKRRVALDLAEQTKRLNSEKED